jgi:hypothetical protein
MGISQEGHPRQPREPSIVTDHNVRRLDTPEGRLVAAAIFTFIEDMNRYNAREQRRGDMKLMRGHKNALIAQARSEWVKTLCGLINLSHRSLITRLQQMADWGVVVEVPDFFNRVKPRKGKYAPSTV